MNPARGWLWFIASASAVFAGESAPVYSKSDEVRVLMERVADWQLAHPATHPRDGWVQAAGYTGIMALAEISTRSRYHDAMMKMAADNQWKPAKRIYHADDHCVLQTYAELYFQHRDPAMIAPAIARFDDILAHPMDDRLEFVGPQKNDRWAWCDSLFMGPPAWLKLWQATGKAAYLDFVVTNWWKTSGYLYDQDEHLYYRDSTYFDKREANGKKVFWSRGNGWVLGGLVRVLQVLPADHPARARFEQQFREIAARVVTLQPSDGFWHSSQKSVPLARIRTPTTTAYGIESEDYSPVYSPEDYFQKPPSNWTSHANGIQLYGTLSQRLVRPFP